MARAGAWDGGPRERRQAMRLGPDAGTLADLRVVTDPRRGPPDRGGEPTKIELTDPDGEVLFEADMGKVLKG